MSEAQSEAERLTEQVAARLQGNRLIQPVLHLLERLHDVGTERDRAGNRQLFFDQYLTLLLLYFFNPTLTSLRSLHHASGWEKTRKALGIRRTSMGSLSEAASVFDAALVEPIIGELAAQALPLSTGREAEALRGLTAVDGSVFAALPRMAWAIWQDPQHRGAKLHLHYDVFCGVPRQATLTPAASSEPAILASHLEAGRLYVMDRGYASYELFAQILQAQSSFIGRVKDNTAFTVAEERPIDEAGRGLGVVRDVIISRLGTPHHKDELKRPMRLVIVRTTDRLGQAVELWLITDRLEMSADLVAIAYRYRWTVELFFRWLKCILGARHLLAHKQNGVTLQMYAAIIVSLLIVLRTGRKPTIRTLETIQFYLMGWVSDAEFDAHVAGLQKTT